MREIPKIATSPFKGVFLDLDGVFADFDRRHFELCGKWPWEVEKKQMWKVVNSVPDFFYSLPMMEDATHLWDYVKQYNPCFLTGLPTKQGSREHKIRWVSEKFGPEWVCHVVPKADKQKFSGPNKILIDDLADNITQWQLKGGLGILHTNVWKTIDKVEELRSLYETTSQEIKHQRKPPPAPEKCYTCGHTPCNNPAGCRVTQNHLDNPCTS